MLDLTTIRNIGIIAHIDAGKTTTTERMLYYTGTTRKMGDVDAGTTTTDYLEEEQERGITITSAAITCHWKDITINLIDTPGHVDFTAEVERSLRVLDGGVVVFSAVEGVEAQSETVWRQADKYHVPRVCFINKMDRLGADFESVFAEIAGRLDAHPVAIQIPIGAEGSFEGIVDLITMRGFTFEPATLGSTVIETDISPALAPEAELWRERMLDAISEQDDEVMARYLDGQPVPPELIRAALRRMTLAGTAQPVLTGSALKYIGVQRLLDAVAEFLPCPLDKPPVEGTHPKKGTREVRKPDPTAPFCGLVFKIQSDRHGDLAFVRIYSGTLKAGTRVYNPGKDKKEIVSRVYHIKADPRDRESVDVAEAGDIVGVIGLKDSVTGDTLCETQHPSLLERIEFPETVISMSIEPISAADKQKLADTLNLLAKEDPTFGWRVNPETGQTIISGMGELHLEVLKNRMLRDYKLQAKVGRPLVSYRETIKHPVRVWGQCISQHGGAGLFAKVELEVEPDKDGAGHPIVFESRIKGGVIPHAFVAAVEAGVRSEAQTGGRTGYPLTGVKFTLVDAKMHDVDSNELAFQMAASDAVRKGIDEAGVVLLEPIMRLEVVVPEDYLGDVTADLNRRRAEITDMPVRGKLRVIQARAPLSEMFGYSTAVRSLSQGRASYTMEPLEYAAAPEKLLEAVLA